MTLGFISGLVEFLMGLLNLGLLVRFVSQPVISAFSTAVAIQVASRFIVFFYSMQFKFNICVEEGLALIPEDSAVVYSTVALVVLIIKRDFS
jgi:MFS superfamily sulfate permease-like transporter